MSDSPPPPTRAFWSQAGVLLAANAAVAVLAAVYAALNGRLLGPQAYANVAASLSLASLLGLLLGPLETGISKFAADFHARHDTAGLAALAFGSLRRLLVPLLLALVVWLALTPLVRRGLRFSGYGELGALTVYTVFSLLASVPRGVQRGDHRFFTYGVNLVVEAAVRLLLGTAAVLLGLGAAGAIGGYAAGMALGFVLVLWQVRDLRAHGRGPVDVQRLYAFSLPLFAVYLYFLFAVNVDMLVAKSVLPASDAGIYGACGTVTRLLYLGATPIYQVLFSRVAAQRARGQPTRALAVSVITAVAAGLALSNLVPWLLGAELLTAVFGPAFAAGAPLLRIQWATISLLVLEALGTFVLLGQHRTRGTLAFLVPCVLMSLLLWRFHGSALQIAQVSLASVAAGMLVVAVLVGTRR